MPERESFGAVVGVEYQKANVPQRGQSIAQEAGMCEMWQGGSLELWCVFHVQQALHVRPLYLLSMRLGLVILSVQKAVTEIPFLISRPELDGISYTVEASQSVGVLRGARGVREIEWATEVEADDVQGYREGI